MEEDTTLPPFSSFHYIDQSTHFCDTGGTGRENTSNFSTDKIKDPFRVEDGYQCYICFKIYSSKTTLKTHSKIHTGDGYECEFCQKTFGWKTNYLRHRKLHTGERPYQCDLCPKKFITKYNMQAHRRDYHGLTQNANAEDSLSINSSNKSSENISSRLAKIVRRQVEKILRKASENGISGAAVANLHLENETMKQRHAMELTNLQEKSRAELQKAVRETKQRQWCKNCLKEAHFHCCWNISYCSEECQKMDWKRHHASCMNGVAKETKPEHVFEDHFLSPFLEIDSNNTETNESIIIWSDSDFEKPKPEMNRQPRKRKHITEKQRNILEIHFQLDEYPRKDKVEAIAEETGLTTKKVIVWFQNQRMKKKPKATYEKAKRWSISDFERARAEPERRKRKVISDKQRSILRVHFGFNDYPDRDKVAEIAEETGLTPRNVIVWFQNQRNIRSKNKT